jgi:metallo-beta-lactamase class B
MAKLACVLFVAGCALACASSLPPPPQDATPLRDDVYVLPIGPRVWRHVSYQDVAGFGLVASNGLVVGDAGGALLVDTAWDPEQTASVLDWAAANVGPVRAVVVTHAHDDRLGGLAETERRGIASFASTETARLAASRDGPPIRNAVATPFPLESLGIAGELYFPGPAHTADNTTVWLAETRILAGGCMVRAVAATSLGNTSEADLESWPRAVAALQARYRHVRIVVPGHGEPGGPELLTHTRALLEK